MPFRLRIIDRVMIVRWEGGIKRGEMTQLISVASDVRERVGQKLAYLAIIPAEVDPPSLDVAKEIVRLAPEFRERFVSFHLILQGDSLRVRIHRGMMSAIVTLAQLGGQGSLASQVHISRNVEEALIVLRSELDLSVDAVKRIIAQEVNLAKTGQHSLRPPATM